MKNRIFCLIFVLLCLVGCAALPTGDTPSDDLRAGFLAGADAVTVTDTAVIFTDTSGRERVEIAKAPASTAILYASLTTLWYEAGGVVSGCIGSTSARELYTEVIGRDITLDDGIEVLSTSAAAKNWNLEAMIAASPDLIIVSTAMNGYATVAPAAEAAGIPVIAVEYNDFADYLKWFKVFCHLTGHPELWESVALAALDEVMATLAAVPAGDAPSVLALFAGSESLQADTSSTVLGEMLTLVGARNVIGDAGGERVEVNLEQIYAADPDVILILCHGSVEQAAAQVEASVGGNPVWQALRAVQKGNVHYLERGLFHNKPNSRFAEAYEKLTEILYK